LDDAPGAERFARLAGALQSNVGQASRLPRSDGSPSEQFVAPRHFTSW